MTEYINNMVIYTHTHAHSYIYYNYNEKNVQPWPKLAPIFSFARARAFKRFLK